MTRQENFGDYFWYGVYFQKPGVAEAELDADVRKSLRTIYSSISDDARECLWFVKKPVSAKFVERLIDPRALPTWLTAEDLDYYVARYQKGGFRGLVSEY
jgi:hypothetical protein